LSNQYADQVRKEFVRHRTDEVETALLRYGPVTGDPSDWPSLKRDTDPDLIWASLRNENVNETMNEPLTLHFDLPRLPVREFDDVNELTASIAHEINQPLTAISIYAQACMKMLSTTKVDRVRLISALDKLNRQTLRAGDIVDRIQRALRHESDLRVPTSPVDVLNDLMQCCAVDTRLSGFEIRFESPAVLPEVRCDPLQVQQVILNLIRNAVDAMSPVSPSQGNLIIVRSLVLEDSVQFEVVDTGTGIAPENQSRVFASFYTTKADGMGVGLAICRSIITLHGGNLNFRNNDDRGATFYFTLPVDVFDAPVHDHARDEAATTQQTSRAGYR